ncbi:unnamed protein product [Mytilus coruscus]|uniref:Uncharacterized protein n=1 Tax=Mytilus coruscus TaxID=42192 RepID=A0A6J8A1W8_MYTCO|nr:unnamed protein product [Mytilus coruscus]
MKNGKASKSVENKYILIDDILYYISKADTEPVLRLYVPLQFRDEVVKQYHDHDHLCVDKMYDAIKVEQAVFYRHHLRISKLDSKWKPFYRIIEQRSPVSFIIKNQLNGDTTKVHAKHLKPAPVNEWTIPKLGQADKRKQLRKTTYVAPPESSDKESENDTDNENSSIEEVEQTRDELIRRYKNERESGEDDIPLMELTKRDMGLTTGFVLLMLLFGFGELAFMSDNIVFDKINTVTTTRSKWLVPFVIDLKSFEGFLDRISNDIVQSAALAQNVLRRNASFNNRKFQRLQNIVCKYRKRLPCSAKRGSDCKVQNVALKYDRVSQLVSAKTEGDVNTSRDVPSSPMLDNSKDEVANNAYLLLKLAEQTNDTMCKY